MCQSKIIFVISREKTFMQILVKKENMRINMRIKKNKYAN